MYSRMLLYPIVMCIVLVSSCASPKPLLQGDFSDKYALEIPDNWKKKGKLVNAITEILPAAMKELQGKDFCFDCKTPYTVKFDLSEVEMAADGGYVKVYRFRAAFSLYDRNNKGLARFTVVDPVKDEMLFYNVTNARAQQGVPTNVLKDTSRRVTNNNMADVFSTASADNSRAAIQSVNYKNYLKHTEQKIYKVRELLQGSAKK